MWLYLPFGCCSDMITLMSICDMGIIIDRGVLRKVVKYIPRIQPDPKPEVQISIGESFSAAFKEGSPLPPSCPPLA